MSENTPAATPARKAPIPMEVTEGKAYYWCACGKSSKLPLCDGTHKGTEFKPVAWTAPETKTVYFCACQQSGKAPLCDGKHKQL